MGLFVRIAVPCLHRQPSAFLCTRKQTGCITNQWLSELALFNFTIKYQTGHSNRTTDTLSCCPFNPSYNFKSESTDSDKVEVISYSATCDGGETIPYSSVCEAFNYCLNDSKIPEDVKQEAQEISCAVQAIVEEEDKQEIDEIVSEVEAVSIFGKVTPEEIKEEQQKDLILKLVYKQSQQVRSLKHLLLPK